MQNPEWQHLNINDLKERIDSVQIADIRDPNSFRDGHIPGAVNLNNENVQSFIESSDLDAPLVVVCYHGHSSQGAATVLARAGFEDVYSLDGGMTLFSSSYPELIEKG